MTAITINSSNKLCADICC